MRWQRNSPRLEPSKLWRVPAALAALGAVALPFAHWIGSTEQGSLMRTVCAHISALGACAAILGLGVGLWTAVRRPRLSTLCAGLFAIAVAGLWWFLVFAPLFDSGVS